MVLLFILFYRTSKITILTFLNVEELLFWRKYAGTRKTSVLLFVDNSMKILLRYISLRIWEVVCHTYHIVTCLLKNNKNEQMMSKGFSAEFARTLDFEPWHHELVQRCLNTCHSCVF